MASGPPDGQVPPAPGAPGVPAASPSPPCPSGPRRGCHSPVSASEKPQARQEPQKEPRPAGGWEEGAGSGHPGAAATDAATAARTTLDPAPAPAPAPGPCPGPDEEPEPRVAASPHSPRRCSRATSRLRGRAAKDGRSPVGCGAGLQATPSNEHEARTDPFLRQEVGTELQKGPRGARGCWVGPGDHSVVQGPLLASEKTGAASQAASPGTGGPRGGRTHLPAIGRSPAPQSTWAWPLQSAARPGELRVWHVLLALLPLWGAKGTPGRMDSRRQAGEPRLRPHKCSPGDRRAPTPWWSRPGAPLGPAGVPGEADGTHHAGRRCRAGPRGEVINSGKQAE